MAEKLQSEVELHDVDLGALQLLVEYSYTGQVYITDENVQVHNGNLIKRKWIYLNRHIVLVRNLI
jgi:hypothetical protein